MLSFLEGQVVSTSDFLVLECFGIGFEISMPERDMEKLEIGEKKRKNEEKLDFYATIGDRFSRPSLMYTTQFSSGMKHGDSIMDSLPLHMDDTLPFIGEKVRISYV